MKVAIIGLGYWGPNIVRNLLYSDNFEIKYIYDIDINCINKVLKKYSIKNIVKIPKSIDEIYNDNEIEAVFIVTPINTHYNLIKKFLENNKHVWVEKPVTNNLEEFNELYDLSIKNKKLLFCDYTYIYHSAVQYLKSYIDENKTNLGKLLYIDSERINLGLFQKKTNVNWDLLPHDLSIIEYITDGFEVKDLKCVGIDCYNYGQNSICHNHIFTKEGYYIHIHESWLSPMKSRKMIFCFEKKMIVWNDLEEIEKIKIYDKSVEIGYNNKNKFLCNYRIGDIFIPNINNKEPLSVAINDFYNKINNINDNKILNELNFSKKIIEIISRLNDLTINKI